MKTLSGIMSHQAKEEYLESSPARYPVRNRAGKSAMIDESQRHAWLGSDAHHQSSQWEVESWGKGA